MPKQQRSLGGPDPIGRMKYRLWQRGGWKGEDPFLKDEKKADRRE